MTLPAAILAGGLATRLGPLTASLPKSLVDVGGQPFAVHQVALLRRNGITDLVFCVGHLGEMIEQALGDGSALGVRIRYSYDGERPLGTLGIVGPSRMDYETIIPLVHFLGETLSRALAEAFASDPDRR